MKKSAKGLGLAIIGGGASGVLTARAIARDSAYRTVLISPECRPGRGVAYGAAEPWHLLNSRAAAMSADRGMAVA